MSSIEQNVEKSVEQKERQVNYSRYLTFFIENEQYALSISHVKEIIASMKITAVPKTPEHVKGVINLRGSVIPVVDVRLKFCLIEKPHDLNTAIIISEIDGISIGFIVDSVEDVLSLNNDHLVSPPKFGSNVDTSYIDKIAEVGEDVVMILNMKEIFESDELIDIKELHQEHKENWKGISNDD